MDHHRSNHPYSRRSKTPRNYTDDDGDNDDDDVVLPAAEIHDSDEEGTDEDEGYTSHRNHPRKHRRLNAGNDQFAPRPNPELSEACTYVLLDVWGERFLRLGRSSLRNEDWNDIVERVSEITMAKLSVLDCRNTLNSLKIRYKKEKERSKSGGISKWAHFKKMDGLMTMSPRQLQQQEQCGLACGVDSGEFVFMNPRVYLDHSNAFDEMRDSPGNSDDDDDDGNDNDEEGNSDSEEDEESYRMLSESVKKIGEIYEKIEDSKRVHMMELERIRVEFQRDLELQKNEIIDQTRNEISNLIREANSNAPHDTD